MLCVWMSASDGTSPSPRPTQPHNWTQQQQQLVEVLYEVVPDTMDEATARVRVLSHALSAAAHAFSAVEAARERLEAAAAEAAEGRVSAAAEGEEAARDREARAVLRRRLQAVAGGALRDAVLQMIADGARFFSFLFCQAFRSVLRFAVCFPAPFVPCALRCVRLGEALPFLLSHTAESLPPPSLWLFCFPQGRWR